MIDRLDYWLMGLGMTHPAIWLLWLAVILGPLNTAALAALLWRSKRK